MTVSARTNCLSSRSSNFSMRKGFRPEVIERALRVCGESMRRISETESDWWRSEVMMPLLRLGYDAAAMDAGFE